MIDSWTESSQAELQNIKSELGELPSICPNITNFTVNGSLLPKNYLSVELVPTEKGVDFVKNNGKHYMILEDITRVFDATKYRENGFKEAVSAKEYAYVLDSFKKDMIISKEISY